MFEFATKNNKRVFNDLTNQKFTKLTVNSLCVKTNDNRTTTYNCKCDCGGTKIATHHNLIYNNTKSCGCIIKDWMKKLGVKNRLPKGEPGLNELYKCYKAGAVKRSLSFELTKDEFKLMTSSNCYYCGIEPRQYHTYRSKYRMSEEGKQNAIYIHNGVDRIINTIGYTIDNSVPCCKICNRAKSNMEYCDFINWINQIKEYNQCQIVY